MTTILLQIYIQETQVFLCLCSSLELPFYKPDQGEESKLKE